MSVHTPLLIAGGLVVLGAGVALLLRGSRRPSLGPPMVPPGHPTDLGDVVIPGERDHRYDQSVSTS